MRAVYVHVYVLKCMALRAHNSYTRGTILVSSVYKALATCEVKTVHYKTLVCT